MKFVIDLIKNLLLSLGSLLVGIIYKIYEVYLNIDFLEKIIFLNSIPAFFAVILPVSKFKIFNNYHYVNNPLAVYMMGIVIMMFITIYFTGLFKLIIRISLNGYYLFWIIYLYITKELTRANPHEISSGYYFNISVPIIYIIFSITNFFYYRR